MASYPSILEIPSEESERVRSILSSSQPVERTPYGNPAHESLYQYQAHQGRNWQEQELAEQAEIQRTMALPTVMGVRARQAAWQKAMENAVYEKQAVSLMEDLRKIDPADPEALSFQDEVIGKHAIAKQALSDPRISNLVKRQAHENEELQTLFDADPTSRQEYAELRTNNIPPEAARQQVRVNAKKRADRVWFATNGGDPAELDSGKYTDASGNLDRAKATYALTQRKGADDALLGSTERKALDKIAEELQTVGSANPDDPETKRMAFRILNKRDPESEEDWKTAYGLVKVSGQPQREALRALIEDFERAGRQVPSLYKEMVGESVPQVSGAPQSTGASQSASTPSTVSGGSVPQTQPVQVLTREAYDALPSGTFYIDGKGKIAKKK